jgi:hypothetical protein
MCATTVHYGHGRILTKANPYWGQLWIYMKAIHVAHSAEQLAQLFWHLESVFEEWESNGEIQPKGKYTKTTKGFWKTYCQGPWATWSIGTYDGYGTDAHDLPGCLPSNQCQESWHRMMKNLLKGKLRGSLLVRPYEKVRILASALNHWYV